MSATSKAQIKSLQEISEKIITDNILIVGLCGIPGSGKSTISTQLNQLIPNSIVIPMDGFHVYRKDLNQEGIKRRGAHFTFDLDRFRQMVLRLNSHLKQGKEQNSKFQMSFPSFDHQKKDPIQNDIKIDQRTRHVIIEGLYIFEKGLEKEFKKEGFQWGLKIFIDESIEACMPRVVERCIRKGIEPTKQLAMERAYKSDKVNGEYVLENSDFEGCVYIRNPQRAID